MTTKTDKTHSSLCLTCLDTSAGKMPFTLDPEKVLTRDLTGQVWAICQPQESRCGQPNLTTWSKGGSRAPLKENEMILSKEELDRTDGETNTFREPQRIF